MPHNPKKKQRLEDHREAVGDEFSASFGDLGVDMLANVFAFLTVEEIMPKRRINKKSREAVKMTTPPPTDFAVTSNIKYNAMAVMTRAIGHLGGHLGRRHKYSDGEDPNNEAEAARTGYLIPLDIEIISNFSKLKILEIRYAGLNGRYPNLFNNFSLLQKLSIHHSSYLKWDLEMLAGFPLLKELVCWYNHLLTGNISNLRVIKDTLEKVIIESCRHVGGNFMDLADFPHLKGLLLENTAVTGDIRDIGENDFLSLEELYLPMGLFGVRGYNLKSISDGPELIRAAYLLKKQRPALIDMDCFYGELSEDSPDWYARDDQDDIDPPPFRIRIVQAGSRVGYRWTTGPIWRDRERRFCEVNWLDPEPDREVVSTGSTLRNYKRLKSR